MINKIKTLIKVFRKNQFKILELSQELEWAHIYHDSIRGKEYLENLSMNIGRWAGNYTFFYILNRILSDFRPDSILELGLGESTKFISTYLDNELANTKHLVVEEDEMWKSRFLERFKISERTQIKVCPLEKELVKGFETNFYKNLSNELTQSFDLYVIDGPYGSPHYSRYDILKIAKNLKIDDEFIMIVDDFNRIGEKETVKDFLKLLEFKGIKTYTQTYSGTKSVFIIATEKYKYAKSL